MDSKDQIAGSLTVRGIARPLVLRRAAAGSLTPQNPTGEVENGLYQDALTGVEFHLPSGWFLTRTDPDPSSPGGVRVFADASHQPIVITARMAKADISARHSEGPGSGDPAADRDAGRSNG